MKRYIIFILLAVSFLAVSSYMAAPPVLQTADIPDPSPTAPSANTNGSTVPSSRIVVAGQTWGYGIIALSPADTVRLIPNFSEKKAAFELAERYGCQAYVNGSFYDTSDRPLGLFSSGGRVLRPAVSNPLINGFIWQIPGGSRAIGTGRIPEETEWSLQTGPVLLSSGSPLPLSIRNDKLSRRTVGITDTRGSVYFVTVFDPVETLSGPTLSGLPSVIRAICDAEHIAADAAVNLDGGSASAFKSHDLTLSELTPVGSLFCISH